MSTALRLRPATEDDMMLYFRWVNDSVVRASAFHAEHVSFEAQRAWFAHAIADEAVSMYVLMADDVPVGQVRLTWQGTTALIAYSVAREHRGHGYGRKMLALVERKVSVGTYLFGQVKQENQASRDIFLSLGYEERFSTDGAWWEYRKRVKCNLQEVK